MTARPAPPPTPVRDARDGPVCVRGRVVELDAALAAPGSDRRCVAYAVAGVASRRPWREVRGVRFGVADDTGVAVVEPAVLEATLGHELGLGTSAWHGPTPAQRALLDRCGASERGWLFRAVHLFVEAVLVAGDVVTVTGRARLEADPGGATRMTSPRGLPPLRLLVTGTDAHPVRVVATGGG